MANPKHDSRLLEMCRSSRTEFWNGSCAGSELFAAIEEGATGATSNPLTIGRVLTDEKTFWTGRIRAILRNYPEFDAETVLESITGEMVVNAASILRSLFESTNGKKGLVSFQMDPRLCHDAEGMLRNAEYLGGLYVNNNVKIPLTVAGLRALEEATYKGVSVNAILSFTVSQSIAVAEAVERALARRESEGMPIDRIHPHCTVMIGRLEDYFMSIAESGKFVVTAEDLEWAGVAVLKKIYRLYIERGYRTKIVMAAPRNLKHWSEMIGGDMAMSLPPRWQNAIDDSSIEVRDRIDDDVDPATIAKLKDLVPEFLEAYDEDGLAVGKFDTYEPTVRTLREFTGAHLGNLAFVKMAENTV